MTGSNILLYAVGAVLAAFGWMTYDSMSPSTAPVAPMQSGSPALSAAMASGQPVLLNFYADWCGPCRFIAPEVEKLSRELVGKAKVVRLNVDKEQELAQQYGIRGIPAFVALKNSREVGRASGAIPPSKMRELLGL